MAEEEQRIKSQEEEVKYDLEYHTDDSLSLRNTRMVNNKLLSDVTFIVGPEKQRIYAHKMPLVTVSEYFYRLFYGNFVEAKLDEIELKDEDPEIFLTMMHIVYGAKVEINDENIRDIYDYTRMYLLPKEYYKPLIKFLTDQIVDHDSAWHIFQENHYYKFESVDALCLPYIQCNPLYYFKQYEVAGIENERKVKIASIQQINCTDEHLISALTGRPCSETDKKKLSNLINESKRSFFSHKLMVLNHGLNVSTQTPQNDTTFSLQLTSLKSVSLHGIGVYLLPTYGDVVVKLNLRFNDAYKEISKLAFNRCNPSLETVNLMFEEILLEKNKKLQFQLSLQNSNGCITVHNNEGFQLIHENIKITLATVPSQTGYNHAIAHLWVKYPECGFGKNHTHPLCCEV
uniref:BTB domain-containing protein n=1 Tax=Anopheles funestus TaxID=62324 RepID=A0A4Y0BDD7_ANOFN